MASPASATQIIPQVQYTNDDIESGGVPAACVVTVAMINPPAPEIANLQFLTIYNYKDGSVRLAYKITAGNLDWNTGSSAASRIARANFYTGAFNHPGAFNQSLTPEGQLLAVLTDKSLADAFAMAFFLGHFTIEFQRTDGADIRQYEVSQQVGADVYKKYLACVNAAAAVP
jgi:hypothetical protein